MKQLFIHAVCLIAAILLCSCSSDNSTSSMTGHSIMNGTYSGQAFDPDASVNYSISVWIEGDVPDSGNHLLNGHIIVDSIGEKAGCLPGGSLAFSNGTFDEKTGAGEIHATAPSGLELIVTFQSESPYAKLCCSHGDVRIRNSKGEICFHADAFDFARPDESSSE